jgi:hypothetical protein
MRFRINSILLCACVALSLVPGCGRESEPLGADLKTKKVVGMVIRENSVMRIDPIVYAARVSLLKRAQVVEVLDRSSEKATVGSKTGYWYKVRTDNGISGWVWGQNIQFFTNKSKESIDGFISNFWEEEAKRVMKNISGKWWSVDKRGDFTNHALEISHDGKYKSYLRGGNPIVGEYNLNFKDNEIIFLKGTTFNSTLHIIQRGTMVYLEKETEKDSIKFQKTAGKLDEDNKEGAGEPKEEADAN